MVLCRAKLALWAALASHWAGTAYAVPSVNVGVNAAFEAPPYLIELLETAAQENATSYFPLLDRIADGHFDSVSTEKELYMRFRQLLQDDGHLTSLEDLSSFDLALSIHSAAPLIESHYQFYRASAEPLLGEQHDESWVYASFTGEAYYSPTLDPANARQVGKPGQPVRQLPFDRVLGDKNSEYASILYADLMSESFRRFHRTVSETAKDGKTSYRVRYLPSRPSGHRPLTVSGYGVELALKRTDYIVIDDRQAEEAQKEEAGSGGATLAEEPISDLRPLSSSEVRQLGLKAASFVMASEDPMDMLVKITQDFPKYSSSIAAMNVSTDFYQEHASNREVILPSGFNVLWINGVQMMPRDINAYSLLEHLRHERKMIDGVRDIGLSAQQAIDLLAHEAITASQVEQDVQRYDWTDASEGGNAIMWMNDIEKDKRYRDWPENAQALLQRTFPGQLPMLRRNLHNVIIPIDFSSYNNVVLIVEHLQSFVKRKAPIRIGLIPMSSSQAAVQQAKIVYHLLDTYGLVAAIEYLEASLQSAGRKLSLPQEGVFAKIIDDRKPRRDRSPLAIQEIHENADLESQMNAANVYTARLALIGAAPPILANGVPIPNNDDWVSVMSQRLNLDIRTLQEGVYNGLLTDENDLAETFLVNASPRRVPLVIPEDDKDLKHVDLTDHAEIADLPSKPANLDTIERELAHMTILADLDTSEGFAQLMEGLLFQREHDNVELAWMHVTEESALRSCGDGAPAVSYIDDVLIRYDSLVDQEKQKSEAEELDFDQRRALYQRLLETTSNSRAQTATVGAGYQRLVERVAIQANEMVILMNGRIVGPIPHGTILEKADLETVYGYERRQRLLPASLAIQDLKLEDKATSPLAFAKISNVIVLSQISDVPEGIFESAPTIRSDFYKNWNSSHTAVKVGKSEISNIQIVASIDPASELAQRWVPILKVLSELEGVSTRIFLNPKERIEELPVKRFYRHVLESQPRFEADGSLKGLGAHFSGLPAEALLNSGMDLPPSWLVAPKECVQDLDNIKLSAVKSGTDIEATYELEHILIEGHSTDVTTHQPPRGAQVVLETDKDPHFADTIIMANLGYFQFKANPGVYNLAMHKGRSDEIFQIDSAGAMISASLPDDNSTEIALTSFRGSTLFPKIARKPGMEDEDVLESSRSTLQNLAESADRLLSQAGIPGGEYLSKAAKFGSSLLSGGAKSTGVPAEAHAEINIFSVASGHLYERMLNIMMLSVMKHTKHTVKFWFIEQFLSPSFKDFLPAMAEEYGFRYEMVTYKWPHWLRGQKEKQREIWGYKILFLDVLFPLDLDKVIFVDADQIVRTDMYELVEHDLEGAPYGFTPMCDSRVEMEGFRFWKQGYWKNFLRGMPYHISALYVVDLQKFRQIAAGDRLRQQYHQLSADPGSLSNLDQDLPNHMQTMLPIHSLPQDWLWCETWCSDEALKTAKTIDLCNNPQTKEPKLARARRQVPEWTMYDDEIAGVAKRYRERTAEGRPVAGDAADAGPQGEKEESIQERLQREDAERERRDKKEDHKHIEL